MDAQYLADRLAISDLLADYAHAVDRQDWDLYRSVFTPEATIDYTTAGGVAGDLDTVVAWLAETMTMFEMSQHQVSNERVSIDGDEATVSAMFYNPMRMTGGELQFFTGGWYHHKLVRTDDGWRSRELVEEFAWTHGMPGA